MGLVFLHKIKNRPFAFTLEEKLSFDFGDVENKERNEFPEGLHLLPQSQNDGLFEEIEDSVEHAEVVWILVTFPEELADVIQNVFQILLFFLFFLTLENPFRFVDCLFFLCLPVPKTYLLHSFYWFELLVVNVNIMGDPHERLLHVQNFKILLWLSQFTLYHSIQLEDFFIKQYDSHILELKDG